MPIVVMGMSHRTAPVPVRERFAVPGEVLGEYARRCADEQAVAEAVLLSTCNRVEVYAVPRGDEDACRVALGKVLEAGRGLSPGALDEHGYVLSGEQAIRHILRVCASLDSLVVGESQILGQVKEAVAVARDVGTLGPVLDRILQAAFRAAKAVRTKTEIARSTVSIGSVAVDLAKRIYPSLEETRVLLVGAGKMGRVTARSLAAAGAGRVFVTNRSYDKALELAREYGWSARRFDELDDLLGSVDIVLTATGASRPIIDVARVKKAIKRRKYRPLFLVDIAVPRDVEQAVAELDTVYLYNVDDLVQVSRENLERRRAEADAAEVIVEAAVREITSWHRTLRVKPTVAAIRHKADALVRGELERAFSKRLAGLDERQRGAVNAAMRGVINKLLHPTMVALRESAETEDGIELAASARTLFGVVASGGDEDRTREGQATGETGATDATDATSETGATS